MEALHSRLTTGEQSGGQEYCQPASPHQGPQPKSPSQHHQQQQTCSPKPQPHGTTRQSQQSKRQNPKHKRLRHQPQSIDSGTTQEHKYETAAATKATTVPSLSPGHSPLPAVCSNQSKPETQESGSKQKHERKPQRPGKYVCTYCGRACAKPSVLQKHIRSHTGERPYPCAPCGFSFKTKSNLYKHRKSHTHRVKEGLALGEPKSLEEQVTESDDEVKQLSLSSKTESQTNVDSVKSHETDLTKECTGGNNDSYAVKKRLALRLGKGKHGPQQDSSDEKPSSLILGSKGSTESGYFSRSESTEQSQDSPPNTSAKSYAEIILGKYGRLGHLQRMSRHQNQQPSGQEDKSIPFTVPKKQVIDHITKLITINEAVVDTSKIDSVKPRRFSLSRKNSSESQKTLSMKETHFYGSKAGDVGYKNTGSITMGVPCEKFHHPSLNVEQPAGHTSTAPLVRSHSVPSTASSFDTTSGGPSKFRQTQSFDEQQPSETRASRRYGMLRRQRAIEIPIGAEPSTEEHEGSRSFYADSITNVPDRKQIQLQPYECEACGIGCKDWVGYKKHKQNLCLAHNPRDEVVPGQMECSQLVTHTVRAGASAVRKRRKEESFESDDPTSPLPSEELLTEQCKDESCAVYDGPRKPTLQTCSVIQHTSSFEKHEPLCGENQDSDATENCLSREEYQLLHQKQPKQQLAKLTPRKLVRQHSVQVPEILVTEDSNMSPETSIEVAPIAKHSEKPDEFQWPQRSPSLAQLPIEKLPPKKKRLRLAEAAQSSGESSFDSISLPRSPSQDSSASYASSCSKTFEESNKPDLDITASTPIRKSRAPHMLTVPGVHQHREMRRSASEQAPHNPQTSVLIAETRSKSFDLSCLSPERSVVGWRERRRCLLMRHTAIRDPDEEEEQSAIRNCSPEHGSTSTSSKASPTSAYCSRSHNSPPDDSCLQNSPKSQSKEIFSCWKLRQNFQLTCRPELPHTHGPSVEPVKEEDSHIHTGRARAQTPQPYPTHGPSGAARAHYLPMSTGLKLEIPLCYDDYPEAQASHSHIQFGVPHISSTLELLRPVTSPAVAVRLQADTLTSACAIYTTLSQSTSPRLQESVDAVSSNEVTQTADCRSHTNSIDIQLWSESDVRLSGSGGNKRMLSPSNSIELPPESQQQQKRVKEEEGSNVECVDESSVDTCNREVKQEYHSCLPNVCSLITHVGPSFPSLLSSTCNSWCYLNYVKPNPFTLDEQKPSVYSTWSTSGYDPNPPGLSSKTALSLLHSKQRLSPSIYTTSPMSAITPESIEKEDKTRPCSTEVYNIQWHCRDHGGTGTEQQGADENMYNRKLEIEREKTTEEDEDVQSCSRNKQSPEVWISEIEPNEKCGGGGGGGGGGSGGGGGGKPQCEDCGCINTRVMHVTQSPSHDSRHCYAVFRAKGSTAEPPTPNPLGKEPCCFPHDTVQGICKDNAVHPDERKPGQYCSLEKGGDDEDRATKDKDSRHDENSRSRELKSCHADYSDSKKPYPAGPQMEDKPSQSLTLTPDTPQKSSAATRRALFARRRIDASASYGSSHSPVIQPQRETYLPHSTVPRPCQASTPPSSLFTSNFCDSNPSPRPGSPVGGLSPVPFQSHGLKSSEPPGSPADTSAECSRLHPREQPSAARLSAAEVGVTHITPHPTRPRGGHNILSHLPLHSQQPSRPSSLLIPIGGIYMIQPRSPLPLYNLVSSPTSPTANTTPWRLTDTPKGRPPLQHRQDTLKETPPSGRAGAAAAGAPRATSKSGRSEARGEVQSRFSLRLQSSPRAETSSPEVSMHVTEGCDYPETTQGQKEAHPPQT